MIINKINPPITYESEWIDKQTADTLFLSLWNELAWLRHERVPRREYYVNCWNEPYTYGDPRYARTYESQPTHPALDDIWRNVEAKFLVPFETCFLNGYDDEKDFLGWHADDSPEMDNGRPIVIVTLGAEREIWFRAVEDAQSDIFRIKLEHGSLCQMKPGMQLTHQHRIPKGDRSCGPRISLTFRGYLKDVG